MSTPVKAVLDYCQAAADLKGNVSTLYNGIVAGANRHGYVYGGQGETWSKELAEKWVKNKRSIPPGRMETRKSYFTVSCAKWYGRTVEDCSGLIVNAIRTKTPGYKDRNAATFIKECTETGKIATIPEVPGICVWKSGHIGIYIGNGWVIEARGTDYGVVKSKLSTQKWTKWGYLSGVDYGEAKPDKWTVTRLLKLTDPMLRGDDVKELQTRLINEGFKKVLVNGELKTVKADGIFGEITAAAVKAFQKSAKLAVDGKAGRNTITALGGVWRG